MLKPFKPVLLFLLASVTALSLIVFPALSEGIAQTIAPEVWVSEANAAGSGAGHKGAIAPLFNNLGDYHVPISTTNSLAQQYFDQGLILAYGFNHAEAARSFQAATQLDPDCALCYWGLAYVLGPNINAAMDAAQVPTAYEAIQMAIAHRDSASDRERAYIQALAQRYVPDPPADRSSLDQAYADAMRHVAHRYPDDPDAQTLFAEALMDTTPWDYWDENGDPRPETVEILHTLESVIEQYPNHAGALHLYIHAVEKEHPELGIAAADRLGDLVPGAGHLVHMPSHIYIRVGRYHDAVVANQQAVEADQAYVTQCHAQGLYPIGYMPHNHHFLLFAAFMDGQEQIALSAAYNTAQMVDPTLMREPGYGTLQHYFSMPLYTMVQFKKWDALLAQPAPDADLPYPTSVWHYGRGMAFAVKGQIPQAEQELNALRAIAQSDDLDGLTIWDINTTTDLLNIASEVLAGTIAAQQGNYSQAIAHLQQGVELEDQLNYDEPPSWLSPVRQTLGTVWLEARHPVEAEQVFREDLEIYPNNHWSMRGLADSLRMQGHSMESGAI